MRKILFYTLIVLIAGTFVWQVGLNVNPAKAATLTVCADGCDHTTIAAAITAATAGDTIDVRAGTYTEDVVINKSLTLSGAGRGVSTIQNASGNAVQINVDNSTVVIEGFTIISSGGVDKFGIGTEDIITIDSLIIIQPLLLRLLTLIFIIIFLRIQVMTG